MAASKQRWLQSSFVAMTDRHTPSHDLAWYRSQWKTLRDILGVDDPEAVVTQVRELQLDRLQDAEINAETKTDADSSVVERRAVLERLYNRLRTLRQANEHLRTVQNALDVEAPEDVVDAVSALKDRADALTAQMGAFDEAGIKPRTALQMIRSMETQLDALYREKEATEAASLETEGDTFQQLEALLAREEKLMRELGVSSIDEVINMVEDMSDQLTAMYDDESVAEGEPVSGVSFSMNGSDASVPTLIRDELGVRTPDDVIAMVNSLTRQLEDLYAARERLAEANLDDADNVVSLVNNMQLQLETLYESQERMSQQGVKDVDHALSMIENMEEQLSVLYEEREQAPDDVYSMRQQLDAVTQQLEALKDEKERLKAQRDAMRRAALADSGDTEDTLDSGVPDDLPDDLAEALEEVRDDLPGEPEEDDSGRRPASASRLQTMEQQLGSRDLDHVAALIHSMDEQLSDPETDLDRAASQIMKSTGPSVDDETLARLEEMSEGELNALDIGVLRLKDNGEVAFANAAASMLPGHTDRSPHTLKGENFFFDLAPSTNNSLFRGRFLRGVHNGSLDVQFPYTFVRTGTSPTNLAVRLHRKPSEHVNWLLFSRL